MPEGPEVRIVADVIHKFLYNKRVITLAVVENMPGTLHRYGREKPKNWEFVTKPFFVKNIRTKGKLILLDIVGDTADADRDRVILITLGMSGDFQYNAEKHKHCRYIFSLDDGSNLAFIDPRCFGTIRIVSLTEAAKLEKKIGWDLLQSPMPDDQWRKLKFRVGNQEIGDVLLEQKYVSGIGNIYRAELCHKLKLNPTELVHRISDDQWTALNREAHNLLQAAYALNGCSVADFTANGVEGQAQQLLQIYGKSTCPRGHNVQSIQQSGRTMWYCSECQPAIIGLLYS